MDALYNIFHLFYEIIEITACSPKNNHITLAIFGLVTKITLADQQ